MTQNLPIGISEAVNYDHIQVIKLKVSPDAQDISVVHAQNGRSQEKFRRASTPLTLSADAQARQ